MIESSENISYQLYFEPYVYYNSIDKAILLINQLDNTYILDFNSPYAKLIRKIKKEKSHMVYLNGKEYNYYKPFIKKIRQKYMGDIFIVKDKCNGGIQFTKQINCINDDDAFNKVSMHTESGFINYISDIYLFTSTKDSNSLHYLINLSTNKEIALSVLSQCKKFVMDKNEIMQIIENAVSYKSLNKIRIIGLSFIDFKKLYSMVKSMYPEMVKHLSFSVDLSSLSDNSILDFLNSNNIFCDINYDKYYPVDAIAKVCSSNCRILYPIYKQQDIDYLIELCNISKDINIYPVLIKKKNNLDFITNATFIKKEEIEELPNKYSTIKMNMIINSNYFGKIYLFPNYKISFSITPSHFMDYQPFYIDELISHELKNRDSAWLNIRKYTKCINCVLRFLCPPPSTIEISLNSKIPNCFVEKHD